MHCMVYMYSVVSRAAVLITCLIMSTLGEFVPNLGVISPVGFYNTVRYNSNNIQVR